THNRVGDGRLETMAAYSAAEGMPAEGVKRILSANTTEDALPVIEEYGLQKVYNVIAERASIRAERFLFGKVKVGTVMVTLKGELLGMDENAKDICRSFGKEIKF
ncbi:MAG: cobalamin biosynthesis protein CbiD, partial [Selenomonadales bacterium]|nr:cobalamin biosynthesis protein CbiD [Selenomonadales bacterium]